MLNKTRTRGEEFHEFWNYLHWDLRMDVESGGNHRK